MNFLQRKGHNEDKAAAVPDQLASSQNVTFTGNDGYCEEVVTAHNVVINSNAGEHDHGSSKVKFKNIVDYNWEQRMYTGQLLAVHLEGKFLAYSLTVPSQPNSGKANGVVRVAHQSTEKRALLKGMRGQVHDLSFAYIASQTLLGCVDEEGNLFIFNIELNDENITHSLILNICLQSHSGVDHRVIWCTYIPDEDDSDSDAEDDIAKLLLTTQGSKAYIFNIGFLSSRFGVEALSLTNLNENYHCIEDHSQAIVDAAFSPDGTSLATASVDGYVMFFQGYSNSDTTRCVYKWVPHDGKPLSSLFFLDNHKSTEQFWKFVVTGAENNSVLKIWSCQSWDCLQTIKFSPGPKYSSIALKAGLDQSAKYLLLSDIHRRVLFILHFDNSCDDNSVYCKKISEFYLPYPILSFGIIDASLQVLKCASSCSDIYDQSTIYHSPSDSPDDLKQTENEVSNQEILTNGCDDVENSFNANAVVRLYLIQPNRLQEGHVTFVPFNSEPNNHLDKTQNSLDATLEYKDTLTSVVQDDTSILMTSQSKSFTEKEDNSVPSDVQQPLNTVLVQQSQQLKNLLMRPQMASSGYSKPSTSPLPSGNMSNISFVPLIPLLQSTVPVAPTSIQPPLNLMTPDAFSSAKRDEEDPPISESPDVTRIPPAPILDSDMQLINNQLIDQPPLANAESLNSLSSNSRVFANNQPQNASCDGKFASGGSSPSREVQEILSVKGSDCFYEDEFDEDLNTQSPQNERQMSSASNTSSQNKSKQNLQDGFQVFNSSNDVMYVPSRVDHILNSSKLPSGGNADSSCTVWPSINLAKLNEANQRKSNDNGDKPSNHNMNLSKIIDLTEDDDNKSASHEKQDRNIKGSFSPAQNSDVKSVLSKLDRVMGLIMEQHKEISVLRGEVSTLRRIQQSSINGAANDDNTNSVSKIIEQSMLRNQVQLKQLVDAAIANRVETDRANREALLSGISQVMGVQMSEKLNAAVAHEACNTLGPRLERILEPLARSLQIELARKLTATDHLLTENIQKLVNNKSVMDNLCTSIAHSVTTATREAFKETIQTSLLPHMEKAQSQMFKQLNQSFSAGTKEYLLAFDNCTKRSLEMNNVVDDTAMKSKSITTQLQSVLEQQSKNHILNSQTQQAIKQLNNLTKELQTVISSSLHGALEHQLTPIKECIREQITTGMAAQAAQLEDCVLSAVRSGTQTPAPSVVDAQAQQHHVDHLLHSGQMNSAFQYALSASDLKLVVYACAIADPRKVFCQPCPLQPNVLLSLIQQLSADMTSDTQLKCSYLGEAVMYLDSENPLTKEHMPIVLKELQRQLSTFLTHNPTNQSARPLRLLLLATESLLKS
ncbi:enhancer of mRNA-decapping protein 4 homolog Ge-1 isoform X2 [Arctopsyche grandis]|uniref:enhancer of mRNA-decapping protein 4 homolog Ge-1 isoform X2 n=1 Tax=Arctopsyche grandis TaxID=121162 RepID=UPI00406D663E